MKITKFAKIGVKGKCFMKKIIFCVLIFLVLFVGCRQKKHENNWLLGTWSILNIVNNENVDMEWNIINETWVFENDGLLGISSKKTFEDEKTSIFVEETTYRYFSINQNSNGTMLSIINIMHDFNNINSFILYRINDKLILLGDRERIQIKLDKD